MWEPHLDTKKISWYDPYPRQHSEGPKEVSVPHSKKKLFSHTIFSCVKNKKVDNFNIYNRNSQTRRRNESSLLIESGDDEQINLLVNDHHKTQYSIG